MKKIGILSDTHGYIHPDLHDFFAPVDEIWHAGDFGSIAVADELRSWKPLVGVFGNCDDTLIRSEFPEYQFFGCEALTVGLMHIGGYPNRYAHRAEELMKRYSPTLFVCGHSHILKVMYDQSHQLMHINPGAAGNFGIHRVMTAIRMTVNNSEITQLEVFEATRDRSPI